jgi:hypothetical protein
MVEEAELDVNRHRWEKRRLAAPTSWPWRRLRRARGEPGVEALSIAGARAAAGQRLRQARGDPGVEALSIAGARAAAGQDPSPQPLPLPLAGAEGGSRASTAPLPARPQHCSTYYFLPLCFYFDFCLGVGSECAACVCRRWWGRTGRQGGDGNGTAIRTNEGSASPGSAE